MWKELSKTDFEKLLECAIKPVPKLELDISLGKKLKKHKTRYMDDIEQVPSNLQYAFYSYYLTVAKLQTEDKLQKYDYSSWGLTLSIALNNWEIEWNLINTYFQTVQPYYSTEHKLICNIQNARPNFKKDFLTALAQQKFSPLVTLLCNCYHNEKRNLFPNENSNSKYHILETNRGSTSTDFFGKTSSEPDTLYYLPIACSFETISLHPLWLDYHAKFPLVIIETKADASGFEEIGTSVYLLYA